MQVRFCIDDVVRAALFRAGYELPDVVEAEVPLAELHPDTRSYLWELSGEGMHRPLTLRVPCWDAERGRRREVAWGAPLVPASASEWEDLLAAYRAAAQAAEAATVHAEDAAWAETVHGAWRWVWRAPVIVVVIMLAALYTVSPFPSVFDDPQGFMLRAAAIVFAIVFASVFSMVWIQAVSALWEDRRRRQEQDVVRPKVAA